MKKTSKQKDKERRQNQTTCAFDTELLLMDIVLLFNVNILTLLTSVLSQGVEVQHGRSDHLDAAKRKAHKVDLGLLQLGVGPGQEHPEGDAQTSVFE